MKDILISVNPKQCWRIVNGIQKIDVRKTKPKLDTPFKTLIYCTEPSKKYQYRAGSMILNDDELFRLPNGKIEYGNSIELITHNNYSKDNFLNGKVIGEYICDYIEKYEPIESKIKGCVEYQITLQKLCEEIHMGINEFCSYGNGKPLYGWHISNLVTYDKPKELSEFLKHDNTYDNALSWAFDNKLKSIKITKPPQSWCYVEGKVYCKDCKYLMFSDCYAECGKAYKGIVSIDDFCYKGELK